MSEKDRNEGDNVVVPLRAIKTGDAGAPARISDEFPWLLRQKVTVPERVPGYSHRPALMKRILPTQRTLTVLKAPGGFGKTTLLAESCRELQEAGVLTAWLTLDLDDAPQILDAYLAFAFQNAGLELLGELDEHRFRNEPVKTRTEYLIRAIESSGAVCVLVLDELERLGDSRAVPLLSHLLRWSPPNLHVAIGGRTLPDELDVASSVIAGNAALLSVDDLRFSKREIADFFGSPLSRRELASLEHESGGWPFALRVLHNRRNGGDRSSATETADNWVASRMWRDLTEGERNLLLDIGLFEWVDGSLINEVFESTDLKRQVEAMPAVTGLLETAGHGAMDKWRLHPLIRDHCARQRLRETPERYESIHRRIAIALARREDTVAAMRHAAEANDAALIGDILQKAGGLRLWLVEGLSRLEAANRFLTPEILLAYPRLALAQCVVLGLQGQIEEARQAYRATAALLRDSAAEPATEDIELSLDDSTVQGVLWTLGCERVGTAETRALRTQRKRWLDAAEIEPLTRGLFEYGFCLFHNLIAEFDASLDWADRTERSMSRSKYFGTLIDMQRGQIAMARGRVAESGRCYAKALRVARHGFLREPGLVMYGNLLSQELDLERNRLIGIGKPPTVAQLFGAVSPSFSFYAAASEIVVDLTLQRQGVDDALAATEDMLDQAQRRRFPALVRYLAAVRVSLLATLGRTEAAELAWGEFRLPERPLACLELSRQSWRELEAVACARLRLLIAQNQHAEGRNFAQSLLAYAAGHELRRTEMRCLALWIALEHHAGSFDNAEDCLGRFIQFYAETDYARPLVRESDAGLPTLEAWIGNHPGAPLLDVAVKLRDILDDDRNGARAVPQFSVRETEVLQRLADQRDKEIAQALELSLPGVRYHIKNIFEKLGVSNRRSAVDRARQLGFLPQLR